MAQTRTQSPIHHRAAVVLALVVAVFAALAPTLSHAIAHALWRGQVAQGLEVCTPQGARWLAAGVTGTAPAVAFPAAISSSAPFAPRGADHASALVHCPFCLQTAGHIAPPPRSIAHLFLARDGQQEVVVWRAFFYDANFSWQTAPRGPPLIRMA